MMTLGNCRKVLAGAVLASAVLWVGTLPGQQKESGTKGKAPAGEGKTLQVKAIKLSNADPEEVRQTLMSVWPQVAMWQRTRGSFALYSIPKRMSGAYSPTSRSPSTR